MRVDWGGGKAAYYGNLDAGKILSVESGGATYFMVEVPLHGPGGDATAYVTAHEVSALVHRLKAAGMKGSGL